MHDRSNRGDRPPQKLTIGSELLKQAFTPVHADDCDQVAIAHLVVDIIKQSFAYVREVPNAITRFRSLAEIPFVTGVSTYEGKPVRSPSDRRGPSVPTNSMNFSSCFFPLS